MILKNSEHPFSKMIFLKKFRSKIFQEIKKESIKWN